MMNTITEVPLDAVPLERFGPLIGPERHEELRAAAASAQNLMRGRTFWNLNSTARGGGVAEMLGALLPYARGAGIDTRWLVIDGDEEFFAVSKRIHNHLHGNDGDGDNLDEDARRTYERTLARNEADLRALLRPGDVVLFHDPQTAGLIRVAKECGAAVVWRCHVGVDDPNERARAAWQFLRPYVSEAERCIFTCRRHVWHWLDPARVVIVPPSIDAFTVKNQDLGPSQVDAILAAAGILDRGTAPDTEPQYLDRNGAAQSVTRRASVLSGPVPDGVPLIVQVSRWDSLKDPVGVVRGFADHIAPYEAAHLVLAGPATGCVDDDPEQAATLADVEAARAQLEPDVQRRVHLVSLPMEDEDENAAMVNALQRRAAIVVQKSLAEGFGLTVAEAMWKERAVVASARGGITEQITHAETGMLIYDPEDPAELGAAVRSVLADPSCAERLGAAARRRVRELFLAPRELVQHFELLEELVAAGA